MGEIGEPRAFQFVNDPGTGRQPVDNRLTKIAGGFGGSRRERFHLLRRYGKSASGCARTRGLDSGVQRQHLRLFGDGIACIGVAAGFLFW